MGIITICGVAVGEPPAWNTRANLAAVQSK
jgi:hypothetical protein